MFQANYEIHKSTTGSTIQYHVKTERINDDVHFLNFGQLNFKGLNAFLNPFLQRGIHSNEVSLIYDKKESIEAIKFMFTYSEYYLIT